MKLRALCSLLLTATSCTGLGGDGIDPDRVGRSEFRLSTGSCPVTSVIRRFAWEIDRAGPGGYFAQTISRSAIDAHCADPTIPLASFPGIFVGPYESLVTAFDDADQIVNDLDASYTTFVVTTNTTTPVTATIRARTGTATGNGSWDIDNASFDAGEGQLVPGCCCPEPPCKGESFVGCRRATAAGICTGWTDPCAC